jgi:hypothetical protein
MRIPLICVLLIGAGMSCREATASHPVAAALEMASGGDQTGAVGAPLPGALAVRVRDAEGLPIESQLVTFVVTAGGGSMAAGSGLTNADGVVEDRWTLGRSTADAQTVEARVQPATEGGQLLVQVFHATPRADAPDTARVVSGDGQRVLLVTSLPDSLLARVVDRFGNPVAGATVAWSVSAEGGTLSRTSDQTTATGYTSTKLIAGRQAGDVTIVATVGVRSATFTAHVAPLTTADLVGRYVLQSVAGTPVPVRFPGVTPERSTTVDSGAVEILANGTAVLTEIGTYASCAGIEYDSEFLAGVTTVNADTVKFAGTRAIVSATTITRGDRVYARRATASALPPAGAGTSLTKVSGDRQSGTPPGSMLPYPLVVQVVDASGSPVAGQVVRFAVMPSGAGGVLDGVSSVSDPITDADGRAQVRWQLGRPGGFIVIAPQTMSATIVSNSAGVSPVQAIFSTP